MLNLNIDYRKYTPGELINDYGFKQRIIANLITVSGQKVAFKGKEFDAVFYFDIEEQNLKNIFLTPVAEDSPSVNTRADKEWQMDRLIDFVTENFPGYITLDIHLERSSMSYTWAYPNYTLTCTIWNFAPIETALHICFKEFLPVC